MYPWFYHAHQLLDSQLLSLIETKQTMFFSRRETLKSVLPIRIVPRDKAVQFFLPPQKFVRIYGFEPMMPRLRLDLLTNDLRSILNLSSVPPSVVEPVQF